MNISYGTTTIDISKVATVKLAGRKVKINGHVAAVFADKEQAKEYYDKIQRARWHREDNPSRDIVRD